MSYILEIERLGKLGFISNGSNYDTEFCLNLNGNTIEIARYWNDWVVIVVNDIGIYSQESVGDWVEQIYPILINEIRSIKLKTILND